jgi:hypothetical protein
MNNLTLNLTNSTTLNSQFDVFSVVLGFYLLNIMTYMGAVLNLFCILIFIKIVKAEQSNQGHLFKYLLIKSLFDCLFCVQNFPQMFYYRADFSISRSYAIQYWFMYCFYFLYPLTSQLSVWFEVAASIDCLFSVSRRFQFHKTKKCFWIVTIALISINFINYFPYLFRFTIEEYDDGDGYFIKTTKLGASRFIIYDHTLIHNIFRDVLPLFISIILNAIIFYYIRQLTMKRKQMIAPTLSTFSNHITNVMVKKAQKAEKNKIKMMFFTSFIHIFHVPVIFFNFNILNVRSNNFLAQLCLLSINMSYFVPIISYAAFNNTFERYLNKIFFCFKFK